MNRSVATTLRLQSLWAAMAVAVTACGGGGGGSSPTPAPPPAATALPTSLGITVDPHIATGGTAAIQSSAGAGTSGLTYSWDFGNGVTATTAQPPAQTYARAGRYELRLTVTNELGASTSATAQLLVGQLASPPANVGCTGSDQGGWCQQAADVAQITFRGNAVAWAADAAGTVLKSTDGGQRWQSLPTGTSLQLAAVAFGDDTGGWALGRDTTLADTPKRLRILRTVDGGAAWAAQNLDPDNDLGDAVTLTAVSRTRAIVSGTAGSRVTLDGGASWSRTLYRAASITPAGRLWAISASGSLLQSEDLGVTIAREVRLEGRIDAVRFRNEQEGWAHARVAVAGGADQHRIHRTSDGGATWSSTAASGLPDALMLPYLTAEVSGFDTAAWLTVSRTPTTTVSASYGSFRSTDGGASWQAVALPASLVGTVRPLSAQAAWIASGTGLYLTRDGGLNWQRLAPAEVTATPADLLMPTDDTLLARYVERSGVSRWARSANGGSSWSPLFKMPLQDGTATPYTARANHFFDADRWLVSTGLGVYATADGGSTWTARIPRSVPFCSSAGVNQAPHRASRLQFLSNTDGRFLSSTEDSLVSTDGGTTWTAAGLPWAAAPRLFNCPENTDLDFRNSQVGLMATSLNAISGSPPQSVLPKGSVYATTAASTGRWTASLLAVSPRSVRWISDTTAVIVGEDGGIARSTDTGVTWTTVTSGSTRTLNRLTVNGTTAWAVGDGGTVLRSDDAGATWRAISVPVTARLNEVKFLDARNGYIVGDQGTVLATTDGGNRWTAQATGTQQDFTAVHGTVPGVAWLITARGYILATVTGGF